MIIQRALKPARPRRSAHGSAAPENRPPWLGLIVYTLFTFASSWVAAAVVHLHWDGVRAPIPLRLVASATTYALCMGWQPLVATWAVRRWIDDGHLDDVLRESKSSFYDLATVAPLILTAFAMAIFMIVRGVDTPVSATTIVRGGGALLIVFLSVCAAIALIAVQAFAEELGWRGYFLPRFMERIGPRRALIIHGVIWGLWYAPVLLMANRGSPVAGVSSASFVVTCMLLGVLLGWLRLASRSIGPSTVANSVLTVTAGLPFVVEGADPGVRAAVYGPAGWLPMSVLLGVLLATRLRRHVRTPRPAHDDRPSQQWIVLLPKDTEHDESRTLH